VRVLLVTIDNAPYLPELIETLINSRRDGIVGIVLAAERFHVKSSILKLGGIGLRRYGFRRFTFQFLRYLRFMISNVSKALFEFRRFSSVKSVAGRYSIPVYHGKDINDDEFLAFIQSKLKPDVIVSIGCEQIFEKGILGLPGLGCINVHPSLLPKYRGPSPLFWVLANGESETGVTVHYMDEKVDNGDIILQAKIVIGVGDTEHSLVGRARELGASLLIQALEQIEEGRVSVIPNDGESASYYSHPTDEDIEGFIRRGGRFY